MTTPGWPGRWTRTTTRSRCSRPGRRPGRAGPRPRRARSGCASGRDARERDAGAAATAATTASEPSPSAIPSTSAPPATASRASAARSWPGASMTVSIVARPLGQPGAHGLAVTRPRVDEQHGPARCGIRPCLDGTGLSLVLDRSWVRAPPAPPDPLAGREIRFRNACKTERAAQIELGKLLAMAPANRPLTSLVAPPDRSPAS